MDVLAFAIVLIALTAFVAAPLYGRSDHVPSGEGTIEEARRAAFAGALSDLEIDHASGLLPDLDYHEQRAELETRAREMRPD